MAHEIHQIFRSKRFVWIVGLIFAFAILHYNEFQYGGVAFTLYSSAINPQPPPSSPETSPPPPPHINPSQYLDPNFKKPASESPENPFVPADNYSSVKGASIMGHKGPSGDIITISKMHIILHQNRASVLSMKPRWSTTVDRELLDAKSQIENAPPANDNDHHVYQNVSRFKRSYELMEKTLKIYIYKEGDKPIFHTPETMLKGVYASEGWFMKNMQESKHFVTNNPKKAHLFYIPFSSRILEERLYVVGSHSKKNMVLYLKNYIHLIARRYNFWNRTDGSDHFMVACHDWVSHLVVVCQMGIIKPSQLANYLKLTRYKSCRARIIKYSARKARGATYETRKSMGTCIRALCNSDVKREGFELGKDVSLPETYVRSPQNPLRELGGKPPSKRSILAFFAGREHSDTRLSLLRHWENKDPKMKIFRKIQKSRNNTSYIEYMKTSKYCICAKGYEVNSPRVVEAIFHECVPVIISDNFVPPFFEILNWESFALFVQEKDIPNLKNILLSISKRRYLVMQQRVKKVQKHFLWHHKPVKYDIFHMILHSIWYNRVFRVNLIM